MDRGKNRKGEIDKAAVERVEGVRLLFAAASIVVEHVSLALAGRTQGTPM